MWRLYCNDDGMRGRGVSLQTTFGKPKNFVEQHELLVSKINYRRYHEVDPRAFNHELDQFMHKRKDFQHENEVRLLRFNSEHYHCLLPNPWTGKVPQPVAADLSTYEFLDWRPEDVIERITISPYADDDYESDVRDPITRAGASFAEKLERSILDPRRYKLQL